MISLPFQEVISKLPVAEMNQTLEDFVGQVSAQLPDARLQRIVPLAVRGILSSASPVVTQMAQGISRTEGTVWAVARPRWTRVSPG